MDNQINEITNCCELSNFNFTFARDTATPGVYLLKKFYGYDRVKAVAYCDINEGGDD